MSERDALMAQGTMLRALLDEPNYWWAELPPEWNRRRCAALAATASTIDSGGVVRDLTAFEEQVAAALYAAAYESRRDDLPRIIDRLAPRVAAAIMAASKRTDSFCPWWTTHGGLTPAESAACLQAIETAALAALRGES